MTQLQEILIVTLNLSSFSISGQEREFINSNFSYTIASTNNNELIIKEIKAHHKTNGNN